jgi:hypothetical protein
MTLKEKFQEEPVVVYQESFILTNQSAERLVELADDYAIEFAEWLSEKERTKFQCKSYCKKLTMWFTDKKGLGATTKELLEQFKKEKGL